MQECLVKACGDSCAEVTHNCGNDLRKRKKTCSASGGLMQWATDGRAVRPAYCLSVRLSVCVLHNVTRGSASLSQNSRG
jgi:hypothetical protein